MKNLLNSKHFCIQPFIHACIWTDGRALPCCINQHYVLGNTKISPISEIYSNNNEKLIALRKEMINGPNLPSSCSRCGNMEAGYAENSYRYYSNKHYGHLLNQIEVNSDGTIDNYKIATWDVRFSNLCNLKCRTCDSTNSSKIGEEERKASNANTQVLKKAFDDSTEFFNFFKLNIDIIEEIYFCGGEPLLLEEHYLILDLLVAHKKFNTVLRYSTNCTTIFFKDKNVVDDYWTKFKDVRLGLSLDAGWEQLFYIRHGTKWDIVLDNLKYIVKGCPHAFLQFSPTISILSVFHVSKLHIFLADQKIIKLNDSYFNILTFPDFYSITALPLDLKEQVSAHWQQYKETALQLGANDHLINEINKVIKYMYTTDHSHVISKFKTECDTKDSLRKESIKDLFPELCSIL